jgi:hypothetical protein
MNARPLNAKVISALPIPAPLAPAGSGHPNVDRLEKNFRLNGLECGAGGDGVKLNARIIQEEIGPRHANAGG